MSNPLVQYSRAGDVFHYRWAARRCLQLVHPNAKVKQIVIEGSNDITSAGEYVIDVTEYSKQGDQDFIDYYQLKHSTVQLDTPFTLSDLESTVTGFAQRFLEWKGKTGQVISFWVITNRKVAESFKDNLKDVAEDKISQSVFKSTLEKYANLAENDLQAFCNILHFKDDEGDYNAQEAELGTELSKFIAAPVDPVQIRNLVAMVQERVLPNTRNTVFKEDVLMRFGLTSERDLYPAPAKLDNVDNIIELSQYEILKNDISAANVSVIVHAEGGVGKSVFCRHLVSSLPPGSLGIIYDCFGAGNYRNRSEPRHGHRQALTQIVNELASKGLCNPLILYDTSRDENIVRTFLDRVTAAVEFLRATIPSAKLIILIDAADNAEMAAHDLNENCFVHELLREQMPIGSQLVFLCRTERIHLLKPSGMVPQFPLKPFSEIETLQNLRSVFPAASEHDGLEFHRLTNANPRVQANALNASHPTVQAVLLSLGPGGMSVEKLIESQLSHAIERIKDRLSEKFQPQVNAICLSLAILPPYIPIAVLSRASQVDESTIRSFVADMGRSIWILDSSVQFRDEPTETWFRNTFSGKTSDFEECLNLLEPLAQQNTYVAEVLPQLYLQSGKYQKLIEVSLTDDLLPTFNPIDARAIRVYRLQFAFKAALKIKATADAIQVAMKAGEEVAGNQRQFQLLRDNIDLIIKLQSKEKIQQLAFKQELTGLWDGAQNVYTASLLSGIKEYRGEARGYLRSAGNWLRIALDEERKHSRKRGHHENKISEGDFLEFAYSMLNLDGVDACITFLRHFNSMYVLRILQKLIDRLIDEGRFDEIHQLAFGSKGNAHYTVAIASKLLHVGKMPDVSVVSVALDLLCHSKGRIKRPEVHHFNHSISSAIVTFAECCFSMKLSPVKILRVLRHYVPTRADRSVGSDRFSETRPIFLQALTLRLVLSNQSQPNIQEIAPSDYLKEKKSHDDQNDLNEFKETVLGLMPWYFFRARVLQGENLSLTDSAGEAQQASVKARSQRYRSHDRIPGEIGLICSSVVKLSKGFPSTDIQSFYEAFLKPKDILNLWGKIDLLNAAGRLPHLSLIRAELETVTYAIVKSIKGGGPDEISSRYIALARAVLTVDPADARIYFNHAIEIASKFGDEIVRRWEAIVELAEQASQSHPTIDSLAHRFIRCAEVVGDTVDREKYWDRYDAMRVCTKMSHGVGLSAVSRWRDREVGEFKYELPAVVKQLLATRKISSSVAWSLSCFFAGQRNEKFLTSCFEQTDSELLRKTFTNGHIRQNQIEGVEISYWSQLRKHVSEWITDKDWIENAFSFSEGIPIESAKDRRTPDQFYTTDNSFKWDDIFNGLDMTTSDGFAELVDRHRKEITDNYVGNATGALLIECVNRLRSVELVKFVDTLLASTYVDRYDVQGVLENLPADWKQKASFASTWNSIIRKFSECYAYELSDGYGFDSFVRAIKADEGLQNDIIDAINVGLIEAKELNKEETFFAYAKLSARRITELEALHLLDYALKRFEKHFDEKAGDGEWSSDFEIPDDINRNVAGVIWSALGSPRASERWGAVHTVRTLIELECSEAIDALMEWSVSEKVGAFGSNLFPFYVLHARQYLLIALARSSMDHSSQLTKYGRLLRKFALESDHILIQKFAIDTCMNIEAQCSGTFDEHTLATIQALTKSQFPVIEENRYEFHTESYWHVNNLIDESIDYHFAWDFDRYWYEPLGEVFGISGKQVQDLGASVLIKEWRIAYDGTHANDPRSGLWNRSSSDRETWHDHGSYPKVDNLDFYLSYHAMLVVAGRLLQKMPVLSSRYEEGNAWENWMSRHLLTRTDGKWLADHRDPVPTVRPEWTLTDQQGFEEWKSSIADDDFLQCLTIRENKNWIVGRGGWHEKKNGWLERVYISSALVSFPASDALLRAWSTASDHHDYKVPDYGEEGMEFDSGIFKLSGWIVDPHSERGLDEFDPNAAKVGYPSYKIGGTIINRLRIHGDSDEKKWFKENNECVAICASWICSHWDRDEEPDQAGTRLAIDLNTMHELCKELESELIIKVSITRRLSYSYSSHTEERNTENEQHRIFILNAHGELRTIGKNYRLG